MLTIQAIAAFKDNYIWFIQRAGSQKIIIVDPGDAAPVIEAIKQQNLVPIALLITHGHHDHIGGVETLVQHYDIPVYGSEDEAIPVIYQPLSGGENIVIDPVFPKIQVLDIAGHTKQHLGYLMAGKLFCGDTLFGAGCGRIFSGTATTLFNALQTIAHLPKETLLYYAHEYTENNLRFAAMIEPENHDIKQRIRDTADMRNQGKPSIPSTLELELATNPFLRCEQADVIRSVQRFAEVDLVSPQEVFTVLRKWKDQF